MGGSSWVARGCHPVDLHQGYHTASGALALLVRCGVGVGRPGHGAVGLRQVDGMAPKAPHL